MSGARLHTLLPELTSRQPVMVVGAAVIDVIADAYALPWRGCDIELKQQSVNVGGCALNIAVALKRLGIEAGNALPLGQGVWAEIIRNRMAKEGLISLIDNAEGDNGWCLALVEPDGERTFMSFSGVENQWNRQWLARLTVAPGSLLYFSGYQLASPCGELLVEWLEKLQDMSTYSYKNPKFINSPKGVVEVVEVIYDGKDDPAYSLAIIKWENTYKLGIRWNIAYSEWDDYRKQNGQDECIGNPQSRGIPTWFVLPDDMMFSEKFSGAMQRLDELRKGK